MKSRIVLAVSIFFGVCSCIAVLSTYYYGGEFSGPLSHDNQDWGAFGSYVGGVLGAVFGFFSFILLVITVLQQERHIEQQMERQFHEDLKQNHLNYMETINSDIRYLLERKLTKKNGENIEFGDYVLGSAVSPPVDTEIFYKLLSTLLRQVAEYSSALNLYRDNFDSYFQYRGHKERVERLANFIKLNKHLLRGMERATLEFVYLQIHGEQE